MKSNASVDTPLNGLFPFLKAMWKHKATIRSLLGSPNFIFVSDYAPGHFYSPIPDLGELAADAENIFDRSRTHLPALALNEERQMQLLSAFGANYNEMPFPEKHVPGSRYHLDNPFFSFGDGVVLYSFLKCFKPKRVVEVGSGFSSAAMLDVSARFFASPITFTFVEPRPERLYALLSDADRKTCDIQLKPVQRVDPAVFSGLEENDILFIDSSHVGKIGSDVLYLLFSVLPLLKPGVIVHFHDIPWPFEYPRNWVEEGRAYNEAYLLRAFLQYNAVFEVQYFNSFMAIHHADAVRRAMPLALRQPSTPETEGNSSIWLRKML